jgi:hypothetical protein
MRIREVIPIVLLVLLLPVFGFVAWEAFVQMREADSEHAAARATALVRGPPAVGTLSEGPAGNSAASPNAPVTSAGSTQPTPAAPAAPAPRDPADIRRRLALGERGTYIGEILLLRDSGLARWPERIVNPLRVWVADGSALPGWNPHYPDKVREAFETWAVAGVPVKFTNVRDSSDADVIVQWVDRFELPITGRTLWSRDRNWWIVSGSLTLALHYTGGEDLDEKAIHAISIHEVGHLLGLDHCADTMNIMTARVRVQDLSNADRATIRLLYSLPPGSLKN